MTGTTRTPSTAIDFPSAVIPKGLDKKKNAALLTGIMRGVERECLRVDLDGAMARTPHPKGLGSALTHPQITTDFSESLLEFITPPSHRIEDLFSQLESIHKFTLSQLRDEMLWTASMPCALGADAEIPVAQYGSSNNGRMKTIYRVGLGHRYGRTMQTVSGVHFNFSLPNAFWAYLAQLENSILDLQTYKNRGYFGLIRNFRRQYWLLIYLFGASPALCRSFVGGREHSLEAFNDTTHTLWHPFATSLRMGDLGYQSSAQESLYVCYNNQESYIDSLASAILKPHEAYERIGIRDEQGKYKQLNSGLLQIENEFYSPMRPKRSAKPGETALSALEHRGVEYVEVRCLDIDPFHPLGINQEQVRFLDIFLLHCALQGSPDSSEQESEIILENQKRVVKSGRAPEATLLDYRSQSPIDLRAWGAHMLDSMQPLAELLDDAHTQSMGSSTEEGAYQRSLTLQRSKIEHPEQTPSAKLVAEMQEQGTAYHFVSLSQARQHHESLSKYPLSEEALKRHASMVSKSIKEQDALETAASVEFDDYLEKYYRQYQRCCGKFVEA